MREGGIQAACAVYSGNSSCSGGGGSGESFCRVTRAVKFIKSLPSLLTERASRRHRSRDVAEY